MITMQVHFPRHTEYYPINTLWAANLIAINDMRNNATIECIELIDTDTGELYRTYVRG